ncbi:hypothetical protein [Actinomadura macrotermitis]|uniref:Uncharacterized protein n=1 Tax=Actinomadura macrotermitis TaxID=2585200 RepID=A0A7K0C342_9ACTN|nr:hypothetical protein [Actinomadura macrotermitis]MQY07897.1 hypothetical protein [Actinomadura macrotermitis]
MVLSARLARFAAARPPSFLVAAPGATGTRLRAEAELRRRDRRCVAAPPAAAVLVVCGRPGAGLGAAVERVWDGMPGPRARVGLGETASREEIAAALETTALEPAAPPSHQDEDVPMADRAADRDGLKLDVLHVPLGPVLADWPAGLALRLTLQGDIVQAAETVVVDAPEGPSFWDGPWLRAAAGQPVTVGEAERRRAASHLDGIGRLLAVAGWQHAADQARALRDEVLADTPAEALTARYAGFARRVRRSRTLRWMLTDVGVLSSETAGRYGLAGYLGDAHDRLTGRLDEIGQALAQVDAQALLTGDGGPRGPIGQRPSGALLAVLPRLMEGAELAAARLTVASLDPDIDQLAVPAEAAGG